MIACGLTFATQPGGWIYALLITTLLANVLAVIIALTVYVVLPAIEGRSPAEKSPEIKTRD